MKETGFCAFSSVALYWLSVLISDMKKCKSVWRTVCHIPLIWNNVFHDVLDLIIK
jgi:hypothetical protein